MDNNSEQRIYESGSAPGGTSLVQTTFLGDLCWPKPVREMLQLHLSLLNIL